MVGEVQLLVKSMTGKQVNWLMFSQWNMVYSETSQQWVSKERSDSLQRPSGMSSIYLPCIKNLYKRYLSTLTNSHEVCPQVLNCHCSLPPATVKTALLGKPHLHVQVIHFAGERYKQ